MEYGLVAVWLVTYLALGAAGLPVAAALLERLPDRGAGVALPLSLTVVTTVALWVGHLRFGPLALGAGLAALVAASVVASRVVGASPDWRAAGETAAVFTVAFLFMIAVRAVDPAVHPILGEKFLDYGMLKAILRTDVLPPEDFWFAGKPVAYYYGGHLSAALMAMLTDTPGRYAYNLALAGYYAMAVTGVYGLAGGIARLRGAPRRTGATFGAFFFGFASNLSPAGRIVGRALPDWLADVVVGLFVSGPTAEVLPKAFNYWRASRVIPGTINEFPLFAWLNGDLHAHMMGPAFVLVLLAVLFAYFRTPAAELRRRRALVFGAAPVVGGLVAVVNTWSFPSVMGLTALSLLFADAHPATLLPGELADRVRPDDAPWWGEELVRVLAAGGLAVVVELVAAVWALPFLLGPAGSRALGFFPDRSGLGTLLLVHGAFLAVAAMYLLDRARLDRDERLQLVVATAGLVAVASLQHAAAVGLFVPPVLGGWVLLRRDADVGYETVLLVAGFGLALAVEFVYVIENAGPGRFNTVFKLYAEVWLYLSLAAGPMVAALFAAEGPSVSVGGVDLDRDLAVRGVVAVLVVSTSLYGALALDAHFAGESMYATYQTTEDPTLDATQFLETGHPNEGEAITWMDENIEGQPNVVTAAPAGYLWWPARGKGAAAPASLTGIPTVAGWHHAADFHSRAAYRRRVAHVESIYVGDPATQARLLRKYDVAYVYFGPAERERYGQLTDEVTVDDLRGVTLVKRWGGVRLYRVDRSKLPGGNGSA